MSVYAIPKSEISVLDSRLNNLKLCRDEVKVDGDSFFRAVAKQLGDVTTSHIGLRSECVEHLRQNDSIGSDPFENWFAQLDQGREEYLQQMDRSGNLADHIVVQATANVIGRVINVVTTSGPEDDCVLSVFPQKATESSVTLGHLAGRHYFATKNAGDSYPDPIRGREIRTTWEARDCAITLKKKTRFVVDQNADPTDAMRDRLSEKEREESEKSHNECQAAIDEFYTKQNKEKIWNKFRDDPDDDVTNHGNWVHRAAVIAKVFMVILLATGVFLGAVVSMATLLVTTNAYSREYSTRDTRCIDFDGRYVRLHAMLILMTCLTFPEALSVLSCLYNVKRDQTKMNKSKWKSFAWGLIPELFHALGSAILAFSVLPYLDASISLLLFSLTGILSGIVDIPFKFKIGRAKKASKFCKGKFSFLSSIASLVLHVVAAATLFLQILVTHDRSTAGRVHPPSALRLSVSAMSSLLLISVRHWENFVGYFNVESVVLRSLCAVRNDLDCVRYKTGILNGLLRLSVICSASVTIFFGFQGNTNVVTETGKTFTEYNPGATCQGFVNDLWVGGITHCLCGFGVFYFGKTARVIQSQSSNIPFLLATPFLFSLTLVNSIYILPEGSRQNGLHLLVAFFFPDWSQWQHPSSMNPVYKYIGWTSGYDGFDMPGMLMIFCGFIFGWIAITLLTIHVWWRNSVRLPKTMDIFVKPIFGGILISQDMLLNKRQYQIPLSLQKENEKRRNSETKPFVYLCATMWHETELEMTQLLTSIMRLDKDQSQRFENEREFYRFEAHIIFDDAMDEKEKKPNQYVDLLFDLISVAAKKVHKVKKKKNSDDEELDPLVKKLYDIEEPLLYTTPYGGRVEFSLPCGNNFVVHLKDKSRIRHRKRWSQCMYMYYILGFLTKQRQRHPTDPVYILALDGDVDFQPESLLTLLDRMDRNPERVGAACGRIHPVGSGPVAWFQKFEYAVGHWLQKTAEHVLGCVLCSPGCFSLFSGQALMDDNIMKRYTSEAKQARHHIQWDQGEDRWLCTLLLKKGYKIEYCALSDSFTFCPEEFKEFYNQRRRWVPSTMANIFEILENASLARKHNKYISLGYIAYQGGLMMSSLLGPATVVLVIQGAFQYVFRMDPFGSLLLAVVPIFVYVILCYTTKQDFQVGVAAILTIIYALVMMAVLVGIVGQMSDTLWNPNSMFMIAMVSMYAFTGLIHPTEVSCLLHGVLYYLCVPSAFILLMVYSLCNMNNVSWGTREVKTEEDLRREKEEEERRREEKEKKKREKLEKEDEEGKGIRRYTSDIHASSEDGYSCGCGDFCRITCCFRQRTDKPTTNANQRHRHRKQTTFAPRGGAENELSVEKMKQNKNLKTVGDLRRMQGGDLVGNRLRERLGKVTGDSEETSMTLEEVRRHAEEEESVRWITLGKLGNGKLRDIEMDEWVFWTEMIKEYLEPIIANKEAQKKVEEELVALKNKMTGAYFLINSLWIVLTFSLTLAIDDINISFYDRNGNEIVLQPLSFLFLLFFLVILFVQFFTMLAHRWSTFVHLMAKTSLSKHHAKTAPIKVSSPEEKLGRPQYPGMENFVIQEEPSRNGGATFSKSHQDRLQYATSSPDDFDF